MVHTAASFLKVLNSARSSGYWVAVKDKNVLT
jgi:hypothetical protein